MRKRGTSGIVFNNTSMLDVIFIILIFFISVSRLKEGWLHLQLPEASAPQGKVAPPEREALVLSIDARNRILANQTPVATDEDLVRAVRRYASDAGPDAPVVFITDRAAASGTLVGALKTVTDEGLRHISFNYEPRKEGGK